jgi:hypothetical protein
MVSKNTNTETSAKKQPVKNTKTTKQAAGAAETVMAAEPVMATEPVVEKTVKKGKKTEVAASAVVQVAPTVAAEAADVKKGGAKKTKADKTEVVAEVVAEKTKATKGSKATKAKAAKSVKKAEPKADKKADKKVSEKKNKATSKLEVKQETEGEVEGEVDGEGDANARLRYFKLIYNDQIQGRYCGKKPKQAANKAFSSIIKDCKKSGQQNGGVNVDINFSIKECTRNSKHKEYKYIGKRQILENPVKVEIANADGSVKQIEYKFHNKLQKAPKA